MKLQHLFTLCLALCSISCTDKAYRNTREGVVIPTENGTVRIQVYGNKIVRVNATPEDRIPEFHSLAVTAKPDFKGYKVDTDENQVNIRTNELTVCVERQNGKVTFLNPDGSRILAEKAKKFEPIEVEGKSGYTITQTFFSPSPDEGLYGLGQHQSEEFNYKKKSEELYQYNTKVSVPFIISTEGYGLLWDSYSYCRFGRDTAPLELPEAFILYNNKGVKGSLEGTYTAADGKTLSRNETCINFDHLNPDGLADVVGLPKGFNFYGSRVRYEGFIEAPQDGIYDFVMYYSGYQTIKIDGETVVPRRWRTAWNPNTYKFSVSLKKGRKTPISIDWEPNGSVAYCALKAFEPISMEQREEMLWWGEMQPMEDYYFIAGEDADEIIHGYRTLTGKASIMPKWAMGYWQSREKYNTQDEVLGTLAEYRKRQIPIDNIVIDWLHWKEDSWGSHEFDKDRFPDPKAMVDSIHDMHGRVMVSVWPKFYVTTEHYKEFDEKGWMYQRAVQDQIKDWVGPGYVGSFYDAYDPGARKLFWKQIQDHYYPLGIDAWWMDASEPNVRDCVDMDYRKALCGPTALGPSTEYFNAYALMNAEAIYDGQRGVDPDKRVFLLTRSGFAGQQRYSTVTWSGDIATRWEDMRAQITAGLNFSISGIPYWTMDIGGFCVEDRYVAAQQNFNNTGKENADLKEWRELNTRWFQFGAFAPLYRAHGQWPFREIFNIAPEGHPAYESMLYYTRLRYRLLPYIYSLCGLTYFEDYTIMRPLVMDFGKEQSVFNIKDQYMFGPAFMVAPVCHYKERSRNVYLPEGHVWYNFYDNSAYEGGETIMADAPYNRMPLFVRSGSILPVGPNMQWSEEKQAELIDLYIYTGNDGDFTLYEDENTNYNYEKGQFSRIAFHWNETAQTLGIARREGSFKGMLEHRRFNVIKVDANGAHEGRVVEYNGNECEIKL